MQAVNMPVAAPVSVHFARRYSASEEFCPRARRNLVEALPLIGISDDGVFAASLYFTELFANAILHHNVGGAEQVHVAILESVEDGERWVGIAVTDAGCGALRPAAQSAPSRAGFGRGLEVVRGMGARLTDVRAPGGYTVTAWTPVSDDLRRRVCQCDCRNVHGREPSACFWLIEGRDGWEQAVRDDDPMAHLCGACLRLLPHSTVVPRNATTPDEATAADSVPGAVLAAAGR